MAEPTAGGDPRRLDGAPVRVLALTGHPIEAAGARHRIIQFLPGMRRRGFHVDHQSFFDRDEFAAFNGGTARQKLQAVLAGTARRAVWLSRVRRYDIVWMHVWLHPVTFPPFEVVLRAAGVPIVYDLDDPYYEKSGSIGDRLRDPGFIVRLLRMAKVVVAGSEYVATFVRRHAKRVEILPTAIDTERFVPRDFDRDINPRPVIGWVGSWATSHFLPQLYPTIARLAEEHDFVFRVIGGAADQKPALPGVNLEWLPWTLDREVWNFSHLDVGLYPLAHDEFSQGKHGFKLHQYMATGVPTVASAHGLNPRLIEHGVDGFLAGTPEEWYSALDRLLRDGALRRRVGSAGRAGVERHSSMRACGARVEEILREVALRRS